MLRTIETRTSFAWCIKNTTARTANTQRATFGIPPRAFGGGSDNVAVVSGISKTEDVGSSIKDSERLTDGSISGVHVNRMRHLFGVKNFNFVKNTPLIFSHRHFHRFSREYFLCRRYSVDHTDPRVIYKSLSLLILRWIARNYRRNPRGLRDMPLLRADRLDDDEEERKPQGSS